MFSPHALDRAISRIAADVELRRFRMSRALPPGQIAETLADQAQSARVSPLASEQILALALDAAARPGPFEAPALDALRRAPDPMAQIELRRQVFDRHDEAGLAAVARAAPDWVLRGLPARSRHDPALLARALRSEADLNAALWDHPDLPASPSLRARMLACVSALRDRADLVSDSRAPSKFARTQHDEHGVSA